VAESDIETSIPGPAQDGGARLEEEEEEGHIILRKK